MAVMAVTPENVEKVRALARHRAGMYGLDRDDAESEMLYLLALGKLHSDAVRSQVRFRLIDLARRRNGRYVRRDLLTAPITVEQAADFARRTRKPLIDLCMRREKEAGLGGLLLEFGVAAGGSIRQIGALAGIKMSPDGRVVVLSWISRTGVGQDGTRWDYASNADPLEEMTPTVQVSDFSGLMNGLPVFTPSTVPLQSAGEPVTGQRTGSLAART